MKLRMKVVSWDMTLHHIQKRFSPGMWHCIVSEKDSLLGYDTPSYPKRILSWDMTLHHIRKGFCPGIWHCIISEKDSVLGYDAASYPSYPVLWWCCITSQKNTNLNHTAVITSGLKK
jgi:hypothetical protein